MEPQIAEADESEPRWEKILWKKQPFPDDYIPPSFLSSLRRNTNVRSYAYLPLVLSACAVTQHLSTIFFFVAVFIQLNIDSSKELTFGMSQLDPRMLAWTSIAAYPFGFVLWEAMEWRVIQNGDRKKIRVKAIKSSILVFLILVVISPVLKTLSEATSSDSIWAMSASLFCLNAILADYSAANPTSANERLTSVLSINAAISASVVLASRLSSNLAVFALILFSVETFALFPLLRQRIQLRAPAPVKALLTLTLVCFATLPYILIYPSLAILIGITLVFVTFACPALFIWAQQYKNELKGPWDPAVPVVR
ncbi:hypothetical protein FRB94_013592 [Tulasnella sp. JGI-2019a]|nr:hypothetical protein FRB93_005065 [Tulasnella sp. JGI-2019a]KAG9014282.1 hypothetical protein FRB94_013592 [Tulasnella sp. JGI-2019a]KAG9030940.1 hypothetical protein FRB95_003324 [Tulasnella sp. JGI-2019a]